VGKEQCWSWSITDGEKTISVNEQEQQQRQTLRDLPSGKL
jgi:protein arginine N-methyltransferase 1